jgi:hypothetical protein
MPGRIGTNKHRMSKDSGELYGHCEFKIRTESTHSHPPEYMFEELRNDMRSMMNDGGRNGGAVA